MLVRKVWSSARRNTATTVTAAFCLILVLHSVFNCGSNESAAGFIREISSTASPEYQASTKDELPRATLSKTNRKMKRKTKKPVNSVQDTKTSKSTTESLKRITIFPVENKWSKEWPRINTGNCSHIEYMNRGINSPARIQAFSYPRTGIVSFPGSGNTWSRHLIHLATGLWTGSVYTDKSLFKGGFQAELDDCEDGGAVAIKAHYPGSESSEYCKFKRSVIVIRDPFRAVLAEFNWRATGQHTGIADPRLYKTKLWMQHVIGRSEKWLTTTMTWIERFHEATRRLANEENPFVQPHQFSKKLLLVSYERMKRDATKEMERVVQFLGLPKFRQQCVQEDTNGNFHRTSAHSESIECLFQKYNLEDAVQKRIDALAKRIRELGIGDITAEFEGPGGEVVSEKCKYV